MSDDPFFAAMDRMAAAGMVKVHASWEDAIDAELEAESVAEQSWWQSQLAWCEDQIETSEEIIRMIDQGVFHAWEGGGADRTETTAKVRQQNVEMIERNRALADRIRQDHPA